MLWPLSDVHLPSNPIIMRCLVILLLLTALFLGYYAETTHTLSLELTQKERDFNRLQRYIGTDKSIEILKTE